MDRRQKKTREAIFDAFAELLSQKQLEQITVGQIIARADVGRATFYAHFETKDYLVKALCEELFSHIFQAASSPEGSHTSIFACDAPDSVFLHLLRHLQQDDHRILKLLSCQSSDLFLSHFKLGLIRLMEDRIPDASPLPKDFLTNHIATTFVETVRWWLQHNMQQTPEQILEYFLLAVRGAATQTGGLL
jgi:AcrR family transcriptional regulator